MQLTTLVQRTSATSQLGLVGREATTLCASHFDLFPLRPFSTSAHPRDTAVQDATLSKCLPFPTFIINFGVNCIQDNVGHNVCASLRRELNIRCFILLLNLKPDLFVQNICLDTFLINTV